MPPQLFRRDRRQRGAGINRFAPARKFKNKKDRRAFANATAVKK
jgi:hypothetical protein